MPSIQSQYAVPTPRAANPQREARVRALIARSMHIANAPVAFAVVRERWEPLDRQNPKHMLLVRAMT